MPVGMRLVAGLVAACWLASATLGYGQGAVLADPTPQSIASVLEAATNLPQILAQNSDLRGEALREAVETERLRLVGILRNDGYLAAEVALEWPDFSVADASSLKVRVNPGPRYTLGAIDVTATPELAPAVMDEVLATAATSVGDNAGAAAVESLSGRLTWALGRHGYPFARMADMDVRPEPGEQVAKVAIRVEQGDLARFMSVDFSRVDPALHSRIAPLIPFAEGDLYSVDALALLRQQMAGLAGVDSARVDVLPEGSGGFSLAVRAKRTHEMLPNTLQANLGFWLLVASLGALAIRQASVSAGAGRPVVRGLSVVSGGLLTVAVGLLALRVFSLI